jgi:DNA-binding CsgD family transcriptional regulator
VMKWLARGYSYSEIATRLEISENTLRTHIKRIYSKFSVNNRVQAVNVARENNIIPSLRYSHT